MKKILMIAIGIFLTQMSLAFAEGAKSSIYTDEAGIAIKGYDSVAFFTERKPTKGSPDFKTEWNGAIWYFSNAAHRDQFVAAPEKYAPQYGGWCAYGASRGYAAKTEPDQAWTIVDNKLYLNWDKEIADKWKEDIPGYLQKSEANWPAIKAGLFDGTTKIYLQ